MKVFNYNLTIKSFILTKITTTMSNETSSQATDDTTTTDFETITTDFEITINNNTSNDSTSQLITLDSYEKIVNFNKFQKEQNLISLESLSINSLIIEINT